MRYIVFLFLAGILYSLGAALYYMSRKQETTNPKVLKSLTIRVALSVTLYLMLMISYKLGWISDKL